MKKVAVFLTLILIGCNNHDLDEKLERTIKHYDIRPLAVRNFENDPKYELGKMLFYDNVLSGNRDTSCATCHLWERGSSDGLPVSIGTNASQLAELRELNDGFEIEHPRNSLDLWNRDNNAVRSLFWDGRVEMIDPEKRLFRTQMGKNLPTGLDNTLAVQAIFPLIRADEMLGRYKEVSSGDLSEIHAHKINDLVASERFDSEIERINSAFSRIILRILGNEDFKEKWQITYLEMFKEAYPNEDSAEYSVVHIANALAHYEELAFASRDTLWDQYLNGDHSALTNKQKKGAITFFGKGRCVVCHSGPIMSDFEFHNLGIPDFGPGFDGDGKDMGRFNATGIKEDKYKFRTPPLRNVSKTYPYFHNGIISSLEDAVSHHNKVTQYTDKYREDGGFMLLGDQMMSISPILIEGLKLDSEEIKELVSFLESLDVIYDEALINKIIPSKVPSGIPIHRLASETKYLSE